MAWELVVIWSQRPPPAFTAADTDVRGPIQRRSGAGARRIPPGTGDVESEPI